MDNAALEQRPGGWPVWRSGSRRKGGGENWVMPPGDCLLLLADANIADEELPAAGHFTL